MALSWEYILFLALAASLFFYGFRQSRMQLVFLLVAGWLAFLLTPLIITMIPRQYNEYAGGILFLLILFLSHSLFRLLFARMRAEPALWWQVLIISFIMTGLISVGLFMTTKLATFLPLSSFVVRVVGSDASMLAWLFAPLIGMVVLVKRS